MSWLSNSSSVDSKNGDSGTNSYQYCYYNSYVRFVVFTSYNCKYDKFSYSLVGKIVVNWSVCILKLLHQATFCYECKPQINYIVDW